jgi:hypothetical protein
MNTERNELHSTQTQIRNNGSFAADVFSEASMTRFNDLGPRGFTERGMQLLTVCLEHKIT